MGSRHLTSPHAPRALRDVNTMAQCIHHLQYEAVEQCEHCHVPLCGMCLWYAASGERLCERCAKQWEGVGHVVYRPEEYAEGIQPTLAQPSRLPAQHAPYAGNSVDLTASVAACLGAMLIVSCVPCANVPIALLALILSISSYTNAKRAIDPRRTQLLSIVGIVSGGLGVLLACGCLALTVGIPAVRALVEAITQNP